MNRRKISRKGSSYKVSYGGIYRGTRSKRLLLILAGVAVVAAVFGLLWYYGIIF